MQKQQKKKIAVVGVFLLIVFVIAFDMCSRTTSPWNKEKFQEKYRVK